MIYDVQNCSQVWGDVFEHFTFVTGVVDRYAADSSRLALCWTDGAGGEIEKKHAIREPDASS
jgi:hypothetical protein